MIRVIIDAKSHQAIRHQGTEKEHYGVSAEQAGKWRGRRLTGFAEALANRGYAVEINDIAPDTLNGARILVLAGRLNPLLFSSAETETVVAFSSNGGGLLLMANHKGLVAPQNQIARALKLPVRFHETTVFPGEQRLKLNAGHPISRNCRAGLRIRTSCKMVLADRLPVTVLAVNDDPGIGPFAAAIETEGNSRRRTVIMTSGGHISTDDDKHIDLWASASNAVWMLNIMDWLSCNPAKQ